MKAQQYITLICLLLFTSSSMAGSFSLRVSDFSEVKAMGNFKVTLTKGKRNEIRVKNADEGLPDDKIVCEVEDSVLTIRLKGDLYLKRELEILVSYTSLTKVNAKLGCELLITNRMEGEEFTFSSESGGKIKAMVNCKKLNAFINAGGEINLDGSAEKCLYKVGAGGTIGAIGVNAKSVSAKIKAGGDIICKVEKELNIKILSGGTVSYLGEPTKLEQDIKLLGTVTKLDPKEL